MAQRTTWLCTTCGHSIAAWSDGNPYYIDETGQKQYAYHPDHERLARCIGNDVPHLCLACGLEFKVDSEAPRERCPRCDEVGAKPTDELEGQRCPFCRDGRFEEDPEGFAIS